MGSVAFIGAIESGVVVWMFRKSTTTRKSILLYFEFENWYCWRNGAGPVNYPTISKNVQHSSIPLSRRKGEMKKIVVIHMGAKSALSKGRGKPFSVEPHMVHIFSNSRGQSGAYYIRTCTLRAIGKWRRTLFYRSIWGRNNMKITFMCARRKLDKYLES